MVSLVSICLCSATLGPISLLAVLPLKASLRSLVTISGHSACGLTPGVPDKDKAAVCE